MFFLTLVSGIVFAQERGQNSETPPVAVEQQNLRPQRIVSTGTLIVEERANGQPGIVTIVPGAPQSVQRRSLLRFIYGADVSLRLPFISANGRLGIGTSNGLVELSAEGGIGTGAFNAGRHGMIAVLGGQLLLAPIPGEIGRRFYAYGKVFRAFTLTQNSELADTLFGGFNFYEAGLGYRSAGERELSQTNRYLFIEAGTAQAFGNVCNVNRSECVEAPSGAFVPNVTIGITAGAMWR